MASAALRSFSRRRKLSPKWFCKTSSTSRPLVLHDHVKDYDTKPTFSESNLLLARSFHRQVFIEERKKMSFGQPLGGAFLCRHISSPSGKPEEWSIKIDDVGDVVEGFVTEKSVEAMVTAIDGSSAAIEYLFRPVYCGLYCAQYVINAIHDFTGLNWSMSVVLTALVASGLMYPVSVHIQRQVWQLKNLRMRIQKVRRVMQTCDPKDLAEFDYKILEAFENKILEAELRIKFGLCGLSYLLPWYLYVSIPMFCISGICYLAIIVPEFGNGGILWFTDLSTLDRFYMLPLLSALTFCFTSKVPTTILSRMKELPLYCILFIVAQAAFKYKSAVYFFLITYKLSLYTLHLNSKVEQVTGVPYIPVTAFDQERIMAGMITIMGEFIDVLKKKDKK